MTWMRGCDAPDCDTWQRGTQPEGWLEVQRFGEGIDLHFCGWECVIRYGAQHEPPTIREVRP